MTSTKGGPTVNQGGASKKKADAAEFEIAGNAAQKGEKPSPSDRDRGETSGADAPAPVDLEEAHDRAS